MLSFVGVGQSTPKRTDSRGCHPHNPPHYSRCLSPSLGGGALRRWDRTCYLCGRGFMRPAELTRHMRSHTGEKPYACHLCPWRGSQSWHLKNHLTRVHLAVPPNPPAPPAPHLQ
ncbi:Zinc finger Y-chromosomal protein 1 [Portunus trituberculatus]|uniref:Zinc finger Y-chromosomal protein 1 n=1 Tax=Portunus trituberculatus TaxID=210409 RepID=A0A5B7CKC4_PORTR|nr:Zinc finger Y-chromosomal protein 1 [Portunus trituberculatus]